MAMTRDGVAVVGGVDFLVFVLPFLSGLSRGMRLLRQLVGIRVVPCGGTCYGGGQRFCSMGCRVGRGTDFLGEYAF